jgi:hypothetical protein
MSCCGSKRESLKQSFASQVLEQTEQLHTKMWNDVMFEYTGNNSFTVKGSVTGRRYNFNKKGEQQLVDYRDASGMRAEPFLKKIIVSST